MKYMIVKFNAGDRQWYYGSSAGLTLMLKTLTGVKNVEINEIKNMLTDY